MIMRHSVRFLCGHRRSPFARPTSLVLAITLAVSVAPLAQAPISTPTDDGKGRSSGRPEATASVTDSGTGSPSSRPETKKIVPNRTLPNVTPPDLHVHFSDTPTASELTHARVLVEPLRPIFTPTDEESRALARAIERYASDTSDHRGDDLEAFATGPTLKAWRPSLLANVATLRAQEGYYSRAARMWDEAWDAARYGESRDAHAVADYAIGKRLVQASTFGQVSVLEQRLKELDSRPVGSNAAHDISVARESFSALVHVHDQMFFSGPEALKAWLSAKGTPGAQALKTIDEYRPPHEGTSLTDLNDLAHRAGASMTMRRMDPSSDVPVPSIVHFRSDHYTAVIAKEGDRYRLRDIALGGELVISAAAMRDEMSGYVLVAAGIASSTGRSVSAVEGQSVFGHCAPGSPQDDDKCPCRRGGGGGPGPGGMPSYTLHPMTASLLLDDIPLAYTPARGPALDFQLRYNQRAYSHANAIYGDVGPRWRYDWVSYVTDNNTLITAPYYYTTVTLRGEGSETYDGGTTGERTHWKSRVRFQQMSFDPPRYERRLADGTVEVYEFADRAASLPSRNIYLTQVIDPQGQSITFTYDAQVRLVAVTDAVGQVTTLDYQDPSDPTRLTKVTDPFGRFATLAYNAAGQLTSITDAIGMTSRFAYDATDFIVAMTTPYGTTTFKNLDVTTGGTLAYRAVEVSDPEGGRERIEYHVTNAALSPTVPSTDVPASFSDLNAQMDKYHVALLE